MKTRPRIPSSAKPCEMLCYSGHPVIVCLPYPRDALLSQFFLSAGTSPRWCTHSRTRTGRRTKNDGSTSRSVRGLEEVELMGIVMVRGRRPLSQKLFCHCAVRGRAEEKCCLEEDSRGETGLSVEETATRSLRSFHARSASSRIDSSLVKTRHERKIVAFLLSRA